jgi:RNA 3'-terminal phosphate cyclase (ATP)
MERVRAKRQKPGLLKQHLTAVEAAKTVGCAEVTGAALGSQTLEFTPGPVTPGNYRFAVGTAGSATLVLQTVLPALLTASGFSTLTLEGGTHNPMAPPFDFLEKSFMPLIHRMGPSVELKLRRPGFYLPVADGSMPESSLRRSCHGWICSSAVPFEAGGPASSFPNFPST